MWMAGGNVKGGATVGATDDFGLAGINPVPLHDVHGTILDLLGLDDKRLTYLHQGRFRRLTDIAAMYYRRLSPDPGRTGIRTAAMNGARTRLHRVDETPRRCILGGRRIHGHAS